jgi:transcriptional regulator with XRE-family HTH domain
MTVELRLQQVLKQHNLNHHGVEQRIANACGLHRHTVGKIYRNESKNPSLRVLDKICSWLISKGVPAKTLPGVLLGFRPAELWEAIAKTSEVTICLGMYKHIIHKNNNEKPGPAHLTVASHDATANSKINQQLTTEEVMGKARPTVRTLHVPFYFRRNVQQLDESLFEEDQHVALRIYQEVLGQVPMDTVILIGSQRANYLVEYFVADLFGCQPFLPIAAKPEVPLYLRYRSFDRLVPSCFGGRDSLPGFENTNKCGIWYLDEDGGWRLCQWRKDKQDSGAVITVRSAGSMRIALFGFSGRSTTAICNELIKHPEKFWPVNATDFEADKNGPHLPPNKKRASGKKAAQENAVIRNSNEIGVYICRVNFADSDNDAESWIENDYDKDEVVVIPLNRAVLEKYLPKRGQSRRRQMDVGNKYKNSRL